jgi:hypothetical protein
VSVLVAVWFLGACAVCGHEKLPCSCCVVLRVALVPHFGAEFLCPVADSDSWWLLSDLVSEDSVLPFPPRF